MKVMILCGGMGTRIRDLTDPAPAGPKPMAPIGGRPILWHIMRYYAHFGFKEFILCLGHKGETIADYFMHYKLRHSDVTMEVGREDRLIVHDASDEDGWLVTLAQTGTQTMTGGRVCRAAKYVRDDAFMLTYGDGLADVDLRALAAHHGNMGRLITVTAVHPSGRFGEMELDGHAVTGFNEKPQTARDFINGGFMVVSKEFVSRYLSDDPGLILEREPMRRAARDGRMAAFRHEGFWQCMDTPRERDLLEEIWSSGTAPWEVWRQR